MRISVIIPVYKNKEMFLENLKNNYQYLKSHEVIVVDDGSAEGLKKDITKKYKKIQVVENKNNMGFAPTVNKGVQKATGQYILLLNSDVLLRDASFETAIQAFEKEEDLFALSFAQEEKDGTVVGKNTIFYKQGFIFHKAAYDTSVGPNAWAEGGACIIRKKYFDKLGGLQELYTPFYWEDIDLSYRAYKRGWYVLFDPHIQVIHHHESTIGEYYKKEEVNRIAYRNQFLFIWLNLFDRVLFILHILSIPYHLVFHLLSGDTQFIKGFMDAVKKLSETKVQRNKNRKKGTISDVVVLHKFYE